MEQIASRVALNPQFIACISYLLEVQMTEDHRFRREILPHLDHLHDIARSIVRDRSRTGDLVLKTLKRARTRYRKEGFGTDVRPWLTEIMKRLRWNEFQPGGTTAASDQQDGEGALNDRRTSSGSEEHREKRERSKTYSFEKVRTALLRIPGRYRRLLVLSLSEELDEEQVADTLDLPLGTVRLRYAKARELLKAELVEMDDEHRGGGEPSNRS